MKITIELVGHLDETGLPGGFRGGEVEVAEGASVADLLRAVDAERVALLVTVAGRAVARTHALAEGAVVRLVPPVGGG